MRYKRQSLKSVCEFGEVGVARSRVERSVMDWDRRGGIWLAAHERGKGGDGSIVEIKTPAKVRKLQQVLHRNAKENTKWRAWSL